MSPPIKYRAAFINRIKTLAESGVKLTDIDCRLKVPFGTAARLMRRANMTDEQRERERNYNHDYYLRSRSAGQARTRVRQVAPSTMAERDARDRAARQSTTTQIIMGDPPPGYSALDQKNGMKTR